MPVPPYGVAIHRAIARGDLAEMKRVAKEAEEYLGRVGDLPAVLALLKVEITKAEKKA
jgi:hypothetical protein